MGVYVVVVVAFFGLVFFRQIRVYRWGFCRSKKLLHGQTVIITGGNSGIGKAAALECAKKGAHVILACRDLAKGYQTVKEILRRVPKCGTECFSVLELDLSSFNSVHFFIKEFRKSHGKVNILINNAAVMGCDYTLTVDSIETQMSVNHYGSALLTNLLMDDLKKSAPSRIIFLTSTLAKNGKLPLDEEQTTVYSKLGAYADSKLANFIYALELNNRLEPSESVSVYLVSPGHVWTKLGRHVKPAWWKMMIYLPVLVPLVYLFVRTPFQGCQTVMYCALEDNLTSGAFYRDCRQCQPHKNILKHKNSATSTWENVKLVTKYSCLD